MAEPAGRRDLRLRPSPCVTSLAKTHACRCDVFGETLAEGNGRSARPPLPSFLRRTQQEAEPPHAPAPLRRNPEPAREQPCHPRPRRPLTATGPGSLSGQSGREAPSPRRYNGHRRENGRRETARDGRRPTRTAREESHAGLQTQTPADASRPADVTPPTTGLVSRTRAPSAPPRPSCRRPSARPRHRPTEPRQGTVHAH